MPDFRFRLALGLTSALLAAGPGYATSSLLPENLRQPVAQHDAVATVGQRLKPFTQAGSEMRLVGEDDTRHLSFYLTPEEVRAGGRLRLVYTNAVSVMPDGASLSASVNGRPIGAIPIRSPQGMLANELPLAQGMLVAGWNTVRLRAQQQHRVDCSIEAAYELWTQIDPVGSGFVSNVASKSTDLTALLSAGRNTDGATELRVITPAGGLEKLAGQSLDVVQSIALLLGRKDLTVIFTEVEGTGAGIDLFIGDPSTTGLSAASRQILSSASAGLSVQQMDNGRVRTVLRGATEQSMSSALATALTGPLQPVLSGRRDMRPRPTIDATTSRRVNLTDVGYETTPFSGHLFRTSFDIVMPEDFYPGDYGSIDLKLNAATAPGLAPGAQILVRVNDRAVTSHVLYNPEGVTLKEKLLGLSLRAFHPGVNKVEILAELPHEADKACDPAARHTEPRFLLLEETALDIPELARVGRLPDLAALAGRAYPFNRGQNVEIVVDAATPVRLSTAATVLARLALASGHPLPAALTIGATDATRSANALVITAGATGLAMQESPALKAARLGGADLDALMTASVTEQTPLPPQSAASDSQALLDAFQVETALEQGRLSWTSQLSMGLHRLSSVVNRWLQYQDAGDTPRTIKPADSLVTLSQSSAGDQGAIWTVMRADNEADLLQGTKILLEPTVWAGLKGGSATVLRSDLSVVTQMPQVLSFYPLTDLSLGNLRRLAAAWLSDHFLVYVGLVLFMAAGLGLGLGYIVPRKGVRTVE